MTTPQEDVELAAREAIYREISKQISQGVGSERLHHLAEAYALVTYPSRSSSMTSVGK